MRMFLGANGPEFDINKKDVLILRKIGFVDFKQKGRSARICLTEKDPNLIKLKNGNSIKIDGQCESGLRLRHFPDNCCPFDTKDLRYILRISKKRFEEFLSVRWVYTNDCFKGDRHIDSRCKYDRFSLHYYSF